MHGQLLALRKLVQLLDPPMHAFMEAKSCLNYFFCYRWLLIHFKREFAFDEVSLLSQAHPVLRYCVIPCHIMSVLVLVSCRVVSCHVSSTTVNHQCHLTPALSMITLAGPAATKEELLDHWHCVCRSFDTVCNGCLHEATVKCHMCMHGFLKSAWQC